MAAMNLAAARVVLLSLAAVGCRHTAFCDLQTQTTARAMSQEIGSFLTTLQSKPDSLRSFPVNQSFYETYGERLGQFAAREQLKEKNAETAQQAANLVTSFDTWKAQHQAATPTPAAIGIVARQFDVMWRALITLEEAKPTPCT